MIRQLVGVFLRGLAMGAADVVPGVSGGTIALITGVYDRLLGALAHADLELMRHVLSGRWRSAWSHVDATFLLTLLAGIGVAVAVLANAISWCLANYPQVLWAFFFGLVGASIRLLAFQELSGIGWRGRMLFVIGTLAAGALALAPAGSVLPGLLGFFIAGAIAICAMILPGISGSFILLLLGMYTPVIRALTELHLESLAVFAAGCAIGLLLFSRFLHWLLSRWRQSAMSVLTGFLLGSMAALWPWQRVISSVTDRHGESRAIQTLPVGPEAFRLDGGEPELLLCSLAALAGVALIVVTQRLAAARGA